MRAQATENLSYKIVAFFVTLVLWLTMLSRKDAVVTRQMALQILLPPHIVMESKVPKNVVVKLSGPRIALQKYSDSEEDLVVDLTRMPPGHSRVRMGQSNLSLPIGIRLLAIDPEEIFVDLKEIETR